MSKNLIFNILTKTALFLYFVIIFVGLDPITQYLLEYRFYGYWRVYNLDGEFIKTWDFEKDGHFIWGKHHVDGSLKDLWLVKNLDSLSMSNSCSIDEVEYNFKNDTLFLFDGCDSFFAVKHLEGNYDPKEEWFLEYSLDVKLPTLLNSSSANIENSPLDSRIFIGKTKENIESRFTGNLAIGVNDMVINYEEIPEFILQEKDKLDEFERDQLQLLLYVDKEIPRSFLNPVLEELERVDPPLEYFFAYQSLEYPYSILYTSEIPIDLK